MRRVRAFVHGRGTDRRRVHRAVPLLHTQPRSSPVSALHSPVRLRSHRRSGLNGLSPVQQRLDSISVPEGTLERMHGAVKPGGRTRGRWSLLWWSSNKLEQTVDGSWRRWQEAEAAVTGSGGVSAARGQEEPGGVHLYRARDGSRFDFVEEFTGCVLLESREVVKRGVSTTPDLVQQPGSKAVGQTWRTHLLHLPTLLL